MSGFGPWNRVDRISMPPCCCYSGQEQNLQTGALEPSTELSVASRSRLRASLTLSLVRNYLYCRGRAIRRYTYSMGVARTYAIGAPSCRTRTAFQGRWDAFRLRGTPPRIGIEVQMNSTYRAC